ncbi:MAG: glycerol-3-phosphate dehydrogenase [Verrucomicrobiales bacterium]|jgi:glycerol-3-phosphate dehydrogenase
MTEQELIAKLEKIERLFAGATTLGEKAAASEAKKRLEARLADVAEHETAEEYKFSMNDEWSRRLFSALLRRYGLMPYRYKRQRYTTVMARVPKSFVDETLWPEFQELDKILTEYISSITTNLINKHIHQNTAEADVVEEPQRLRG